MLDLFTLPTAAPRHGRDIPRQQTLFGIPTWTRRRSDDAPSITESETSRMAAKRIAPYRSTVAHRVLSAILAAGRYGRTDHELAAELDLLADTVRSRRLRLRDDGAVLDSGRRRRTPSGCLAVVWVAAGEIR